MIDEKNMTSAARPSAVKAWIEAMRLRTLPVSVAGVLMGWGYALVFDTFRWLPAVLCLLFAVLAQIASNFANEYFDYKAGLDRPGRIGPRRGVTEGDITARAMLVAALATLGAACAIGCTLMLFGGWWLIWVGLAIAIGVMAYSAGPFPLSHIGLGEVAVMFFFGIIPVNFTFWLQSGVWNVWVVLASVSVGLMGANVLVVNNYRDRDDDAAVGKRTLCVMLGRRTMSAFYLTNGYIAVGAMVPTWLQLPPVAWLIPAIYLTIHSVLWWKLWNLPVARLNPLLGLTAANMLLYTLLFLAAAC